MSSEVLDELGRLVGGDGAYFVGGCVRDVRLGLPVTDVDVVVPVVPEEHERLYFFSGRDHHAVPGTVTINGSPYVCDKDGARFTDREVFLFHLQRAHGVEPSHAAHYLMVRDGRVHVVGD